MARGRELEEGSSAHYSNAAHYDRTYRRHRSDLPFYLSLAAEIGDPILELGCGTGRLTLPLARAGHRVVGIDSSAPMLAAAAAKLARAPRAVRERVDLRRADMRSLELGGRFRLVVSAFNTLQHLYSREHLEAGLASVRRHLMPRAGRFAFDVLVPDLESLGRDPARRYKLGTARYGSGTKRYLYRESFRYDPVAQVQAITMFFDDAQDPASSFSTLLCHRQLFPAELEAVVHYNGFRLLERYGGFDRSPLGPESENQVCVCSVDPRRAAR